MDPIMLALIKKYAGNSKTISDEEILNWLYDTDIITPLVSESDELYIANNSEIYIL